MEFYQMALIFITCMIALALLIYYCQEKRNPKYSFTSNQKAISAIALSFGAPGLPDDFFGSSPYASTMMPYPPEPSTTPSHLPSAAPEPPSIGFKLYQPPPPGLNDEEDLSDCSSSSSSNIYFNPHTTAYSVNKRMSMSAKMERRMSQKPQAIAEAAAYLLARRLTENRLRNLPKRSPNVSRKPPNASRESPPKVHQTISPEHLANRNQYVSDSSDSEWSTSIPATVVAFHRRNKSRSSSPYVPLHNQESTSDSPSLKQLPERSESLPPPKKENGSKGAVKRGASLPPPKQSENLAMVRSDSTYSERFPFANSEFDYRSHSPTPLPQLHTVEEED